MKVKQVSASLCVVFFACVSASGVDNETVLVGNPGNPADMRYTTPEHPNGVGAVPYTYRIGVVLATAPWIPWSNRFRLRTLLIATTLVAVVLGLIVTTSR